MCLFVSFSLLRYHLKCRLTPSLFHLAHQRVSELRVSQGTMPEYLSLSHTKAHFLSLTLHSIASMVRKQNEKSAIFVSASLPIRNGIVGSAFPRIRLRIQAMGLSHIF